MLHAFRHFAVDNTLCQTFNNRGLAHAWFTNKNRIVLGATLQYLDGATNFIITTNHRIELALFGTLGKVNGIFLQRLALLFGIGIINVLTAADILNSLFKRAFYRPGLAQNIPQRTFVVYRCQHKQFAGNELITPFLRQLVGQVQETGKIIGNMHVTGRITNLRQAIQRLTQLRTQQVDVNIGLGQQVINTPSFLIQHGAHQMHRLNIRVIAAHGETLGIGYGQLKFAGKFIHSHDGIP